MIERLPDDAVVFFSDEAHFHISGCVNKQNMRYWSSANPREIHQRLLHSDRVTVWCAISRIGIIAPYFFDGDDCTVTVNSERYVTMIQEFLELNAELVCFQQDGATAHTARKPMAVLREMFPRPTDLPERRHFVARALTKFNTLRLFLVGVSKGRSV